MHRLRTTLCLICALTTFACAEEPRAVLPEGDPRLTLSTPHQQYLLGEPVPLELKFQNRSQEPLKVVNVVIEPRHYEAPLRIARKREVFREFSPNTADLAMERRTLVVKPGEAMYFMYRAVAAPRPEFRLAFPRPGDYDIYAIYPLWLSGALQTEKLTSNAVRIRIKQPEAEDALVWRRLNNVPMLTLLQTEFLDERHKDAALSIADLLRDHPASGYAPAMRYALSKIYFRHRFGLERKEWLRLAEAVGINDVDEIADARLNTHLKVPIEKQFLDSRPVGEVLAYLSKAGVPLDATPALKSKTVNIFGAYSTLRLVMRHLGDVLEASWERRGDGYFLMPFQAARSKVANDNEKRED